MFVVSISMSGIALRLRTLLPSRVYRWGRNRFLLARYKRAVPSEDGKQAVLIFREDFPAEGTLIQQICRQHGYRLATRHEAPDAAFLWKDATYKAPDPYLISQSCRVINVGCTDISKSTVDRVFEAVFGYGIDVDPRRHEGPMVIKSVINGLHDGRVVTGPVTDVDGRYVYQRLIDTRRQDGLLEDLRVTVCGREIPLVLVRRRHTEDRFKSQNDHSVAIAPAEHVFARSEIENILRFAKIIGLDFGQLDVLRDADDRIYVVDANDTPTHLYSYPEKSQALDMVAQAFDVTFISGSG